MVDRDRVLAKLDDVDRYLGELRALVPERFEEYEQLERKRAGERTVQLWIEAVMDTCALLVIGLRLGLPGEPDGRIDDHRIFRMLRQELGDFDTFRREILALVQTPKG